MEVNSTDQIYPTDVLTTVQLEFLAAKLSHPERYTSRPAYTNLKLLPGILKVLRSGCRWRDLNLPGYPDGTTHWRRLQFWKKRGNDFRNIWKTVLRMLHDEKKLNFETVSIVSSIQIFRQVFSIFVNDFHNFV